MRAPAPLSFIVVVLIASLPSAAAEPTLSIAGNGTSQQYTAATLRSRKDTVAITVPDDVSYHRSMTYRAVPLLALLGGADDQRFDTLEARATDGFVAQIPLELVAHGAHGGAIAWLAVEDPAYPWPPLPNRKESAGPFYLVWEHPQRSDVRSEQWPYELISISLAESPSHRWPQLSLPPGRASDTQAAAGQKVFVALCLPCHKFNGAGVGQVGPDLGQPMNATRYLTEAGLRALIRNPRDVRTWPAQRMTGFGPQALPEQDLDALVAYLRAMADAPGHAVASKPGR